MKKPRRSQQWRKRMTEKANRTCGDCKVCCIVMSVRELGKPYAFPCHHLCDSGCSIYNHRPMSCAGFACLWRQGAIDGEGMRPDKSGVMFAQDPKDDGVELGVFELHDGVAAETIVSLILARFAQHYDYVTIYPLGSIGGVSCPLSDEYPNCGEVGYAAPAFEVADGISVYNGIFRPRQLLVPATGKPTRAGCSESKSCTGGSLRQDSGQERFVGEASGFTKAELERIGEDMEA